MVVVLSLCLLLPLVLLCSPLVLPVICHFHALNWEWFLHREGGNWVYFSVAILLRGGWFLVHTATEPWARRKVAWAHTCEFRFSWMAAYLSIPLHGIVASFVQQPSLLSAMWKKSTDDIDDTVLLRCAIVSLPQSLSVFGNGCFLISWHSFLAS